VSLKGRVFLELLRGIVGELGASLLLARTGNVVAVTTLSPELLYILDKLQLDWRSWPVVPLGDLDEWEPEGAFSVLLCETARAMDRWGVNLRDTAYQVSPQEIRAAAGPPV
jgi:hypothetical protein